METTKSTERSIGTLFRELTEDISTLVRSEIALAKLEVKHTVISLGAAIALFLAALFAAFAAAAFLLVTIVLVLALWMPAWVASLIVMIVLLAGAGLLAWLGKKKLGKVEFVPTATIESVKTDVESIRQAAGRRGAA